MPTPLRPSDGPSDKSESTGVNRRQLLLRGGAALSVAAAFGVTMMKLINDQQKLNEYVPDPDERVNELYYMQRRLIDLKGDSTLSREEIEREAQQMFDRFQEIRREHDREPLPRMGPAYIRSIPKHQEGLGWKLARR